VDQHITTIAGARAPASNPVKKKEDSGETSKFLGKL
jgi:hypothetical protein